MSTRTIPPTDGDEAKQALEKAKKDLAEQRAMWPRVNRAARALADALDDNHFADRIRFALEAHHEHR